jgi:pimeloyl-ACP methyl ester carboxylesterase
LIVRNVLPLVLLASWTNVVGCAAPTPAPGPRGLAFVVPGASGDGVGYSALREALRDEGFAVMTHTWGAPLPLFALNFSNRRIHEDAEKSLRQRLRALAEQHPGAHVVIVGHSAGCGVALGALSNADAPDIDALILLAPSVSPGYNLAPAARRVRGSVHSFHSELDVTFLKWRTGNFGSYDGVKTPAAGHLGFDASSRLLPDNLAQHAYSPSWAALGNDGGHFGTLSRRFLADVVMPLLRDASTRPSDSSR